ncbi:hypothetical protein K440DRAFT_621534 [Wilcoxina mikolae CBS 423.85]|nr:hypothetical protein K440DRAFT_621534 [Wilcoxina mikolae CBS 423.85]
MASSRGSLPLIVAHCKAPSFLETFLASGCLFWMGMLAVKKPNSAGRRLSQQVQVQNVCVEPGFASPSSISHLPPCPLCIVWLCRVDSCWVEIPKAGVRRDDVPLDVEFRDDVTK